MKDYSPEELEASRPSVSDYKAVSFCLERLYADKKHEREDEVVQNLTFEELIGALLLARDAIEELAEFAACSS